MIQTAQCLLMAVLLLAHSAAANYLSP